MSIPIALVELWFYRCRNFHLRLRSSFFLHLWGPLFHWVKWARVLRVFLLYSFLLSVLFPVWPWCRLQAHSYSWDLIIQSLRSNPLRFNWTKSVWRRLVSPFPQPHSRCLQPADRLGAVRSVHCFFWLSASSSSQPPYSNIGTAVLSNSCCWQWLRRRWKRLWE